MSVGGVHPEVRELNLILDLCLRIGEVLLSSGAGAADVVASMQAVAHHLGITRPEVDVTFTQLSMSYSYDPEQMPLTLVRRVTHRDIDYEDLTLVNQLVLDVVADRVDVTEARSRMATVVSTPHAAPRWVVTVANGAMCGAVAVFLGGGPIVAAIAFLAAAAIDRVQLLLSRLRLPGFYVQVAGGGVATLFAVAAAASGLKVDPSLVVTANIVMLLAGIGFMGALQDALTGFYVTATARMMEALLATAGIIAGVSGGLALAGLLGQEIGNLEPGRTGWEEMPVLALGAAACAAAFAVAVYAPWRVVGPIAAIALVAACLDRVIANVGLARPWGAGAAALAIGLVAYAVAGRVKVPPLVIVVPAIVPLLPGLSIYRGLSLLTQGTEASTAAGLLAMMTAASVAIALASGVILGEWVAQPLKREARRLETRLAGPRLVGPFKASLRGRRKSREGQNPG